MAKIFCVEDDEGIRELVMYALKNEGFTVMGFSNSIDFFKALSNEMPELVLLDIMLPGEDGMTILEKIKSNETTRDIAVIMLTAQGNEYNKVVALNKGADDYIVKPFGVMELISRVKALFRRVKKSDKQQGIIIGNTSMDYENHIVKVNGLEVKLTYKEFELLYYFMQNPNMVLNRDKIMQRVWGFDFEGESRTVDMHMKSLRQKLEATTLVFETVRGVGYRLIKESVTR